MQNTPLQSLKMNIKDEFFMQTLFQINSKTNLNIDNLPSLSALLYQAAQLNTDRCLTKSQFLQIGMKFCALNENDAHLLFNLFQSLTGQVNANPRYFTVFLFAVLFKSTVSSKRQKILTNDLWPQQVQTFESMLEQYVKTCSDLLCASLCVQANSGSVDISQLRPDQYTTPALRLMLNFSDDLQQQTALQLSVILTQQCVCNPQPSEQTERVSGDTLLIQNQSKRAIVYQFSNPLNVKIYNCASVVIYLLRPIKNLTISACKHIKIFAPVCTQVLSIQNSRTVNLSSCANFLKVFHSDDVMLNVSANVSCIQDAQTQTIFGAPFNLIYEHLIEELEDNKMGELLQKYEQYKIVGPLGLEQKDVIQNATDFVTQVVPYGQSSKAKFAIRLDDHFRSLLNKRVERLRAFQSKMENMKDEERNGLENEVKGQLMSWVQQKGLSSEMGWVCQAELKVI
ncbi:Tubulin_binding cofactor C family protein [Hexamita inflata]|uniref:Tubulin binding cofactor C family protein n=1 Tax=Hexamita inflata TaxID=28002 RepID=A0AA86Q5B3_9EUKA|nr:Tubulin binding cofactor C family protein [Hexamita inflata]